MTTVAATARLVAARRRSTTRCDVMRAAPPLTFRCTGATVHLVGTAAGPIGGDRLALEIEVGPGAELDLRSVASTIVLPGPRGEHSSLDVDVVVGPGGRLRWQPQPVVLVDGADHRVRLRARVDPTATVVLGETAVLGRTGEPGGSVLQRLDVEVGGRARVRSELRLGPRWPDADSPAVTGGARVVAQILALGPGIRAVDLPLVDGVRGALMELGGGGVLGCVLGNDTVSVGRAGDAILTVLDGSRPATPQVPSSA